MITYNVAPTRQYKHVSEELVQSALALYFDYMANHCFRGVYVYGWEADFVVLTKSMRLWEVEIKISMADWKADAEKQKWQSSMWSNVTRFYYAVPSKLLKDGIPAWVPEWAGVLELQYKDYGSGRKLRIKTARKAKDLGGPKLKSDLLMKLYRSTYFRFWRNQRLQPDAVGCVDCRDEELLQLIAQEQHEHAQTPSPPDLSQCP